MNRREHLLTILGEECSELHKEACKIQRFGLTEMNRGKLQHELNDIFAIVEMLADEGIAIYKQKHLIYAKKDKVEKYLIESKQLGTLEDEVNNQT